MLVYTIVGGGLIFMMPAASSVGVFIAFTLLYGPCGGVCMLLIAYPLILC